jgi:periplasmic protein TonB
MMGREHAARRGAVGGAIVVAHLGLVALLIASGVIQTPAGVPAVNVAFLQEEVKQLEQPTLDEPTLTPMHRVLIPPPEVVVQVEPTSASIAATVVQTPPPAPPPAAPSSGNSVPEMSDVAYLVQPSPHYPPESRRTREQGLVILRVIIDEAGHAKAVEIYRSSGHPRLDEAARDAVAHAVFKPYVNGGVARVSAAIVPIEFSVRASSS